MGDVSLFDWLRWIEVPVWLGIVGMLVAHIRHDYTVEREIRDHLGELKGLHETLMLILDKLIPNREDAS